MKRTEIRKFVKDKVDEIDNFVGLHEREIRNGDCIEFCIILEEAEMDTIKKAMGIEWEIADIFDVMSVTITTLPYDRTDDTLTDEWTEVKLGDDDE